MQLSRRKFLHLAAGAAAFPALPRVALALDYPSRPVHLDVGFAAGSTPDLNARVVGQWLGKRLGQSFVVENRPGAGTNIASETVAHATADGYTLLYAGAPSAINATLYDNLNFNFIADIAPVASVQRVPLVLMANPSLPAKTLPEFIAYARSNPRKISFGSPGIGTVSHLSGELLKSMSGIDIVHVPYRGGGGSLTGDLLGGQVQVSFLALATTADYIHTEKLRGLAVTSDTRLAALPDIPAVAEFVAGYESVSWEGLCAPRNTPPVIVGRLNDAVNAWLAEPDVKARLAGLGGVAMPMSPPDFGKFIAAETQKWAKVIHAINIKAE